ncbi:hypothetical protein [Paenisporosarcina indica]|uniref:hypothetical protein n=1 Tax=Paenisporosarcina indica TaxID=650093 RepID=UPI00094FE718|nr:hypothetical protein [Paenisporosarcina indica]
MRNALKLANGFVVTTDNSGGIGEKQADIVVAPNDVVSYFAARVTLLEQWTAHAEVESVIIQNFSGETAWQAYKDGVKKLLEEVDLASLQISGSSETNMELMQSAMAVTMIGRIKEEVDGEVTWFIYGQPFVGSDVLEHTDAIADLKKIKEAITSGVVKKIWPVGSKGIQAEARALFVDDTLCVKSELDVEKSAGPSTVVFIGVSPESVEQARQHFTSEWRELVFTL